MSHGNGLVARRLVVLKQGLAQAEVLTRSWGCACRLPAPRSCNQSKLHLFVDLVLFFETGSHVVQAELILLSVPLMCWHSLHGPPCLAVSFLYKLPSLGNSLGVAGDGLASSPAQCFFLSPQGCAQLSRGSPSTPCICNIVSPQPGGPGDQSCTVACLILSD